ncbi:phosphatase PAP2 family protein [Polystyrenella longa]|nr:phosphatase PAP2 family protein [Polystyrenella longa]
MANSSIDEKLRHKVQQNIRSATSDDWFEMLHAQKELGNGYYTLPLFAASWMVGEVFDEDPRAALAGTWGERSLRAFAVGAPPMLLAQRVTGASRPGEATYKSNWNPLQDNNGVSGHSFMGAIPFLTAAKMTDEPWLQTLYYGGSTLAAFSRVNDDHHYASQAFLGWGFAWLATRAVFSTDSRTVKKLSRTQDTVNQGCCETLTACVLRQVGSNARRRIQYNRCHRS